MDAAPAAALEAAEAAAALLEEAYGAQRAAKRPRPLMQGRLRLGTMTAAAQVYAIGNLVSIAHSEMSKNLI